MVGSGKGGYPTTVNYHGYESCMWFKLWSNCRLVLYNSVEKKIEKIIEERSLEASLKRNLTNVSSERATNFTRTLAVDKKILWEMTQMSNFKSEIVANYEFDCDKLSGEELFPSRQFPALKAKHFHPEQQMGCLRYRTRNSRRSTSCIILTSALKLDINGRIKNFFFIV